MKDKKREKKLKVLGVLMLIVSIILLCVTINAFSKVKEAGNDINREIERINQSKEFSYENYSENMREVRMSISGLQKLLIPFHYVILFTFGILVSINGFVNSIIAIFNVKNKQEKFNDRIEEKIDKILNDKTSISDKEKK